MASLFYVTLSVPKILFENITKIQELGSFSVYKYDFQKGIIFRIPHGVKVDDVCHFFMEHEINLSNTLRSGSLTPKTQVTLVPVEYGIFNGFENLEGEYYWDEEDGVGYQYYSPDYKNEKNIKKIAPLPPINQKKIFNELKNLLFKQVTDVDLISKYAVHLGCQKKTLKDRIFISTPELAETTHRAALASKKSKEDFSNLSKNVPLIPESK